MDGAECGQMGRGVAVQMSYQVGWEMCDQVGQQMSDWLSGTVGDLDLQWVELAQVVDVMMLIVWSVVDLWYGWVVVVELASAVQSMDCRLEGVAVPYAVGHTWVVVCVVVVCPMNSVAV